MLRSEDLGYSNGTVSHIANYNKGIFMNLPTSFEDIDSTVLVNINVQNVNNNLREIYCYNHPELLNLVLRNINVTPNFEDKFDYD